MIIIYIYNYNEYIYKSSVLAHTYIFTAGKNVMQFLENYIEL